MNLIKNINYLTSNKFGNLVKFKESQKSDLECNETLSYLQKVQRNVSRVGHRISPHFLFKCDIASKHEKAARISIYR